MKRTEVNIISNFPKQEVKDKMLFLGSCFAQNIGFKFQNIHLDAAINPLGVVFHPIPLFRIIDRAIKDKLFIEADFFEYQDYWFNYHLSGTNAKFDLKEAVNTANEGLGIIKDKIKSVDFVFITLGSAVARFKDGLIVANCHKQPNSKFTKMISSVECMLNDIEIVLEKLFEVNSKLKIYFTVSPVRHSKEGVVENSLSKSSLILLCHKLTNRFKGVSYLPIYELMLDELRDYSFYEEDLVHPNLKSINFIWERLIANIGSDDLINYVSDSEQFLKSIQHESLHPKSRENIKFLTRLRSKIENHQKSYSVSWVNELESVENLLKVLA